MRASGPGREDHDAGGQRDRDRRPDEHSAPADPVAEPTPNEGARHRAETGGQQDRAALPIGQRPFLGQRRGDIADQEEIEEIEQIGDVGGADQLPLIGSKLFLLLQALDHGVPLRGRLTGGATRQRSRGDVKFRLLPVGLVTPVSRSKPRCAGGHWPCRHSCSCTIWRRLARSMCCGCLHNRALDYAIKAGFGPCRKGVLTAGPGRNRRRWRRPGSPADRRGARQVVLGIKAGGGEFRGGERGHRRRARAASARRAISQPPVTVPNSAR